MSTIELTEAQSSAVEQARSFVTGQSLASYFSIGGYAGTGKTTIVKHLIESLPDHVVGVCTFTGKASSVLRAKGVSRSTTIHRKIYEWDSATEQFHLKPRSSFPYNVIVIDEASMVPSDLLRDLLSFGPKIIAIGDPGQLPPIGSSLNLVENPNVLLEEIHRQSKDNPVIQLATEVRNAGNDDFDFLNFPCQDDRLQIVEDYDTDAFWDSDVILCSTNQDRVSFNSTKRARLGLPRTNKIVESDRIIFLQNNRDLAVYNGQTATVKRILRMSGSWRTVLEIELQFDDGQRRIVPITEDFVNESYFDWEKTRDYQDVGIVDFGYALTAHKAQGSEWDSVSVYRLPLSFGDWDQPRWDYTSITRTSNRLVFHPA